MPFSYASLPCRLPIEKFEDFSFSHCFTKTNKKQLPRVRIDFQFKQMRFVYQFEMFRFYSFTKRNQKHYASRSYGLPIVHN